MPELGAGNGERGRRRAERLCVLCVLRACVD